MNVLQRSNVCKIWTVTLLRVVGEIKIFCKSNVTIHCVLIFINYKDSKIWFWYRGGAFFVIYWSFIIRPESCSKKKIFAITSMCKYRYNSGYTSIYCANTNSMGQFMF